MTENIDAEKVKRGRGRPRKNVSQDTTNTNQGNNEVPVKNEKPLQESIATSQNTKPIPMQRTKPASTSRTPKKNVTENPSDGLVTAQDENAPKQRGRKNTTTKANNDGLLQENSKQNTGHRNADFDENNTQKNSANKRGYSPRSHNRPPKGNMQQGRFKEDNLTATNQKNEAKTDVLAIEKHPMNLPMQMPKGDIVSYESAVPMIQENANQERRPFNRNKRGHKGYSKKSEYTKPKENSPSEAGTDFVGGAFGVSAYGGDLSLGEYGERAALGVLGIADEAPNMDAVLPLVDVQKSVDEKTNIPTSQNRGKPKGRFNKNKNISKDSKASSESMESSMDEDAELLHDDKNIAQKKTTRKPSKSVVSQEDVRRVLYVSAIPDEQVEVVITENGVVSEYFVEMAHQVKIRGNIYKGIINNVDTNLQAAFVNFGCGKNGFLQIDEVHPEYWVTHHIEGAKYPPIQKVLRVGQEVLVQVVKEPVGTKGAFLTTWISLAGRFLVLTPGQEQIGVSRKVENNEERERLRELLSGIKPGEDMGVIIRTASEGASKVNIQKDLKFLKQTWKDVQKKVVSEKAPSMIYQESDLASRAVRDYLTDDINEVWVDSEEMQNALKDLVQAIYPRNKDILKHHQDSKSTLWERFNILRQLDDVTKREVNLPSGGRLVFDQTEALMAIDINSGKVQGKSNFESMVFRTNMEAAEAIARHLRLRDIGGQVVIDFIEMRDRGHTRDVEKCLRNAMKRDRARHDVGKISSFGLLELVRQRTGTSAISLSSEPCPHCHGTGFRRNMEWQAQGVLRDIKSKLSTKQITAKYVHEINADVGLYLLNKKRDRLCELEAMYNIKIEIRLR